MFCFDFRSLDVCNFRFLRPPLFLMVPFFDFRPPVKKSNWSKWTFFKKVWTEFRFWGKRVFLENSPTMMVKFFKTLISGNFFVCGLDTEISVYVEISSIKNRCSTFESHFISEVLYSYTKIKLTLNAKRFVQYLQWKKRFFGCGKKCKTVRSMCHNAYATLICGLVESNWVNAELVCIVSTI